MDTKLDLRHELELLQSGDGVSPADDRKARAGRYGLRHGGRPRHEPVVLERAHRAVPKDRTGSPDRGREHLLGLRPDVEALPTDGYVDPEGLHLSLARRSAAALAVRGKGNDVDRQDHPVTGLVEQLLALLQLADVHQ